MAELYYIVCINVTFSLSVHQLMDSLAVVNIVVVNIGITVSLFYIDINSFRYISMGV
jgi:hypothetical protein